MMIIKWQGDEALIAKFGLAAAAAVPMATDSIEETATAIYDRSQELVPVLTGALKSSGRVEVGGLLATISYGGSDAPYGAIVHEDLTLTHVNGQAKFLEQAVVEEQEKLGAALLKRMLVLFGMGL